jgi:hypothetical protein
MLETGEKAPDFTLPDQDGNDVSLSSLAGTTVVLYFYPKADTPGVKCSSDRSRSSPWPGHRDRPRLASERARGRLVRFAR